MTPESDRRADRLLDSKSYVEHHPTFGYRYIPGTNLDLPKPGGGRYHIQVNSQGIRSDREYKFKKPSGITRRILVCGDSMAAGQFVSNNQRFTELLERRNPGLEVINLALEGSGTDQQTLIYEHIGLQYEHDAVLLVPFLQNVRRNMVDAREGIDPNTGSKVLRAKPRYELVDGQLVLRNVPVPLEVGATAARQGSNTDSDHSWSAKLKSRLSAMPGFSALKKIAYGLSPWEPFTEYRDPDGAGWRLMEALVHRLKSLACERPLLVAPTFYANYVRYRMARNYWLRYASLASKPGIHPIDLLPHFRRLGPAAVSCFQEPYDMHFSAYGHLVLADALEEVMGKIVGTVP